MQHRQCMLPVAGEVEKDLAIADLSGASITLVEERSSVIGTPVGQRLEFKSWGTLTAEAQVWAGAVLARLGLPGWTAQFVRLTHRVHASDAKVTLTHVA